MKSRKTHKDFLAEDNKKLREALMDAAAHLIGSASAYEKYGRRYKHRGPSDPFYSTRLKDFKDAGERARKACLELCDET